MAFKMKRGMNPSFKSLGSSPIQQHPKFKSHIEANMPGHAGVGATFEKPPIGEDQSSGIPQKGSPAQLGIVKTLLKNIGKKTGKNIAKRKPKPKLKPKPKTSTKLEHKINQDGSINKTTKAYKTEFGGMSTTLPETVVSPKWYQSKWGWGKKILGTLAKGGAYWAVGDKIGDIWSRYNRTGEFSWSDIDDVDPSGEETYYESGDSTKTKFTVPEE